MADAGRGHHAERVYATLNDAAAVGQSAVAASWSRSALKYGLDPNRTGPPHRLSRPEFASAYDRLRPLIDRGQGTLDRLFQAVGEAGCCVLLTDRDGVPLERRGAPGDDVDFRNRGLWTGMNWSEASEGTNGVGTCLAECRPVTIYRDQHFLTRNIGLSCTVAPIWDERGRLIATLDVSTCRADLTPAILKLLATAVADAARRIEAQHFRAAFPKARILVVPDGTAGPCGLLAVDRQDLVIGASRAARPADGHCD
ncbi:MAG: GAF domain-containing protein, partial [Bosea sp. (in: a-proteobacteria)]